MNDIEKMSININKMHELSQDILKDAAKRGASQAEVVIRADKGFSVNAREGQVETVEYNQDKSIEVKVFFGKRSGVSSLSDIRPEAVTAAVEAACHIATFTDEDSAAGLAEKNELAFGYPAIPMAYPWSLTVEQAIELACQCEREAVAQDKRIMSADEVNVSTGEGWFLYANSYGFTGDFASTQHQISCVLVAKEGAEMQRDYSYTIATDPADLTPVSAIAKEAAERTVQRLGARRLKTMKTPVIFHANVGRIV